MKLFKRLIPLALTAALSVSCVLPSAAVGAVRPGGTVEITDGAVALAAAPSDVPGIPVASGKLTKSTSRAIIDYSNTQDGYVMVKFTASTTKRLKVQIAGPSYSTPSKLLYSYDLPAGQWVAFPLSDGSGTYKVTVAENTTGTKYAVAASASFAVSLKDEFTTFLQSNQFVDYAAAPKTVAKAKELVGNETDVLKQVEAVYNFVVKELVYDDYLAATVQSGYLPVLDSVLAAKKGICFDYAALMSGMLRSQGVPCKLVTGYVPVNGKAAYHAWISVWSKETGWVDGAIYFDGTNWQRMDPTFASSSGKSASIMKYIGDGTNYTPKYYY